MLIYIYNRYKSDEYGATAVEYALIAGGIALAIIAGVALIGGAVEGMFTEVGSGL